MRDALVLGEITQLDLKDESGTLTQNGLGGRRLGADEIEVKFRFNKTYTSRLKSAFVNGLRVVMYVNKDGWADLVMRADYIPDLN